VKWAEVIVPFAGPGFYTYGVGEELEGRLAVGSAVAVQFGAGGRKIVGGIVLRVHGIRPAFDTKPVLRLLFDEPVVWPVQLRLWEWMADYYVCSPGEVMAAAIPALLKPSGFSEEEFAADEFSGRRVRMVGLGAGLTGDAALNETLERLRRRAPKQYHALVEIAGHGEPAPRTALTTDSATLAALQKKGLVVFSEQEISHPEPARTEFTLPELSPAQQTAFDGLRKALKNHKTALLYGVPASGKSEVCFHAIAGTLARGKDVLLLLPEIALTTQFVERVRRVFGPETVLYHSALSDRKRAETYIRLTRAAGPTLVVGARSAIFLPLPRLGLVVVDEEQDSSYKQDGPAPRYNARDSAVVLAARAGANTILASATPSLETWANTLSGKYGIVELTERWGGTQTPEVIISDTLRAVKRGERRSHFNKELLDSIGQALGRNEQVILFQNRRGLAPYVECTDCGHVPRCGHCAIPMSLHRGVLRCHYCGASTPLPERCPSCGSGNLSSRGFGTEKIEEELARLFPAARIARLDRDSATSERAFSRIIGDFEAGATDILVGTQMVTKGLDFENVSLVGVLNADNLMNHPDFRASERAYTLIAQVAGRAGRHPGDSTASPSRRGRVVIQTAAPENRLLAQAAAGDYRAMAADALDERARLGYPPYSRLVSVMLRHADRELLGAAAAKLKTLLVPHLGERLLGPQPPVAEKIKGEYALIFLAKIPRNEPMSALREILAETARTLAAEAPFRRVTLTVDVDPQ
jgi:primosomal protein N' (replication factor Y)